jgi:hypothetical protein
MRRIEITAIERERMVIVSTRVFCPVCQRHSELLTVSQAAAFVQVKTQSVRRWLAKRKAHGVKTIGGRHRVCKNSLLQESAVV